MDSLTFFLKTTVTSRVSTYQAWPSMSIGVSNVHV
jgi:hypothetical protein